MASASFCDPCTEVDSALPATKYCTDCEERLCTACAESHIRFRAFKTHHVIDLSSVGSNIQLSAKKICNVHPDMLIDYYCTDHEVVCCRECIPKNHRKCENVLPLEHASKDIKNSALFTDIMADIKDLIKTLNDLHDNRESNVQLLAKSKSVITKQIREVKSRFLKEIDNLERNLYSELSSLKRKHETEFIKQKNEITQVLDRLKVTENEIDFLKDHGSNNQLFIALHQQVSNIQNTEAEVLQIISNAFEIEITFDEKKVKQIDYVKPLLEIVHPCQVQYVSTKIQQAQIMAKRIVGFEKETELKLKSGQEYEYNDVSITTDNKMLLTDFLTLYVYTDCRYYETEITFSVSLFGVAVIPGTSRAVVTLPDEKSIQFINTSKMTKGDKIEVGFECNGITAGHDIIFVGGTHGSIQTLDINGTILKLFQQGFGNISFLSYDDSHKQLFVRCLNKLRCINLEGAPVYSKSVSGLAGLACDRWGNIYYGGYYDSKINRMTSNWKNCEEMLNEEDGIEYPYGMCFNNDFTKLFVINNDSTSVYVYKCKHMMNC